MLKRSFKSYIPLLPITFLFLWFTTNRITEGPLITPPQLLGFFNNTEMQIVYLLTACCCFILPNKYEIELSLVCGTSAAKLFFSKCLPVLVYTLLPSWLILALFRYSPYVGEIRPKVPIFIPENYKPYVAVSFFVTIFFFFALFCFFRVLTRSCYISIFPCMFVSVAAETLSVGIKKGIEPVTKCYFNPFMSEIMLSDEIPNAYAAQVPGMEIMKNAWTYNRLIFFAIGVLLLVGTYLLLRREELHKGFGD